MPTYDYRCPNCKFTLSVFHKMNEKPCVSCLACNSDKDMEKVYNVSPALHFKGTGFYQTDYKNAG